MAKDNSYSTTDYIFLGLLRDKGRQTYWFRKRRLTEPNKGKVIKVMCERCTKLKDAKKFRDDVIKEQEAIEKNRAEEAQPSRDGARATLKDLFAKWCDTLKAELRPSTYRDLEALCKPVQRKKAAFKKDEAPTYQEGLYVRAFSARKRNYPGEVTYDDIETLLKTTWGEQKGRTLLKHYYNLRRFFAWCIKQRVIKENPAASFEPPNRWYRDIAHAAKETGQLMTVNNARRFLAACRGQYVAACKQNAASGVNRGAGQLWRQGFTPPPYLYTVVLTGFLSGLRLGNILGMRWRHINLAAGTLTFEAHETKHDEKLEVPLHEELWKHFRDLLNARTANGTKPTPHPDDLVLGVKIGEIKNGFKGALRRAGLFEQEKPFRCHDMRHSFRTWLHNHKEGDAAERLLGHKIAGSDVVQRYIHLTMDDLRNAVNQIPCLGAQEEHPTEVSQS